MEQQTQITCDNKMLSDESFVGQLERQIRRGHLFSHGAFGKSFTRQAETTIFLHALCDLLLSKGIISENELERAIDNTRQELIDRGELTGPGIAVRVESPEQQTKPPVPVDCSERMHICHSVCCKLDFGLTIEEVESGAIKWDLGRPYFVRHERNGYCTHNDHKTGQCGIYMSRPGICRRYSCADDDRIWKDFAGMELNTAWIEANLTAENKPRLEGTFMEDPISAKPIVSGSANTKIQKDMSTKDD